MRRTKSKSLLFLWALLTVLGLNLLSEQVIAQNSSNSSVTAFPAALFPCLPELKQYPNRYILAQMEQEGITYYYVGVNEYNPALYGEGVAPLPDEKRYWAAIIASNSEGSCKVLVGRNQYSETLMAVVPKPVAQQFALVLTKRDVQVNGGLSKYQTLINQDAQSQADFARMRGHKPPPYPVAPETAWAYQQLGVKLPPGAVVMPEPKN